MSRKDFEAVAKVLREAVAEKGSEADLLKAEVAKRLADYFWSRNTRFDRARFLAACEVE